MIRDRSNAPESARKKITDFDIEQMVSVLLRSGVLLAGAVVLGGGLFFLWSHGSEAVSYQKFAGQPSVNRHAGEIIKAAFSGHARSIIQFGILLLIATPIARVALSLVGFTLEGDRKYVTITGIVLAVLLYSLITGATSG